MPDPPPETFTALAPKNWLQAFIARFKDDEDYGFHNRHNPENDVFKAYNVIQSVPESIIQFPSLWVTCTGFEAGDELGQAGVDYLYDFEATVDIYAIVHRETQVPYDDKTWVVPGANNPEPDDDLLFLLLEYIGQKMKDNPRTTSGTIVITDSGFEDGEFFRAGVPGLSPDTRGVVVTHNLEVQLR